MTIKEFNGELVLEANYGSLYQKPVVQICYYPTGIKARLYPELIGLETGDMIPFSDGIYPIHGKMGYCSKVRLKDGKNTLPIHSIEIAIAMPRKNKKYNWVWKWGAWQKESITKEE